MTKYKAIKPFKDEQDTGKTFPDGREYAVGDEFPATQRKVPPERLNELASENNKAGYPVIEIVEEDE